MLEKVQKQASRATMAELEPGEWGIVDQVGGEGALHRHLLDMGLTPGVRVTLKKTAPMGDPLEIHLRGYALTLRKADAARITLRPPEAGQERGTEQRRVPEGPGRQARGGWHWRHGRDARGAQTENAEQHGGEGRQA